MVAFYEFLYLFKTKCVLAAHNCKFDYTRLLMAMKKTFMETYFKSIIFGFVDTLPLIKKCTQKKGKGQNTLVTVANNLQIETSQAHDALADVLILEKVVAKFNISYETMINCTVCMIDIVQQQNVNAQIRKALKNLNVLNSCTSSGIRKNIAAAQISYEMILKSYEDNKLQGLQNLLGNKENGNIKVTKNKKVIQKIYDFLLNNDNII
ncbi:uncharacterized protein LOC131675422 [Phymastichus coffea]|uniref:uncharacterized protein LOC131675422 n=1 Tax=Phymastichus coffea TaxID=108790 RepID=UPI00273B2817|nr:uncharacterized protein LOC131675422 [Phymastichus coffea]